MPLRPGEIVLRDATRSFSVRADNSRTLKGLLIGRRASGPPPIPALRGVSLHIEPGQTVGIVGRNGAGKTSTLKVLAGIVPLQSGEAACGGRVVSLLELASGFSRDFSGRENILLQGALYGLSRAEIEARMDSIIAFSELGDFIEVPVKTYSSGMFVRLGFAIAAHLEADVLLIDEVLAVGDEAFQRKCLRRISEQIAAGATLVLVSHDPGSIERVCGRVVVLDGGTVVFDGPTAEGLLHYHRLMGTEFGGGRSLRPPAGAGGVEVTELELRDGAGHGSGVFRRGSALQVIVGLQARERCEAPRISLELRSESGAVVFRESAPVELGAAGSAQLVYEIPEVGLLGGDYDIGIGAGEEPAPPLQRTVRFAVAREEGPEGIVDLHGAWRTPAATPGAGR
jgi:ABC-type polysaccharide/polyol phosphate transport system ATPase subunit